MHSRKPHFALRVAWLLLSLWLMVGPFLLGFGGTWPQRQDLVAGLMLLPLALLGFAVQGPVRVWLLATGVWLLLAPDVSGEYFHTGAAMWHDRIVGLAALFLGLIPMHYEGEAHAELAEDHRHRFGLAPRHRGWTALWQRQPIRP